MPTKTSPDGAPYEIDGRRLTWHPEDDDGNREGEAIVIPLRIKMRTVLAFADSDTMDNPQMVAMLRAIIPAQFSDALEDMDVNDFQDMFSTWQREYNTLTGASLGESSGSGGSEPSSAPSSSSTSEPVSASA